MCHTENSGKYVPLGAERAEEGGWVRAWKKPTPNCKAPRYGSSRKSCEGRDALTEYVRSLYAKDGLRQLSAYRGGPVGQKSLQKRLPGL